MPPILREVRMLVSAPLIAVVLALVACAGNASDELDAEEYAQRVSAICSGAETDTPDRSKATTKADLGRIDETIKRSEQRWLRELRAVTPPPELSQLAREWLAAVEDAVLEWDTVLDASAGRIPWSDASLARVERAGARADRLAEALGAIGCTSAGIGEGFDPYSLTAVRRAFAAHGVRFTAPTDPGTAFGYSCPPPDGWRLLVGRAWMALLFSDAQRADRYAACLGRSAEDASSAHLREGNLVVVGTPGSIPPPVRAALSDLR
jgi:hypothetical protein